MKRKKEPAWCVPFAKPETLANAAADLAFSIRVPTIPNANLRSKPNQPAPSAKNAAV